MDGVILALDQGTTGTTVLVFAEDGTILGRAYAELRQYYPHPGWVEQDPEELWQVSRRAVTQALDDAGVTPKAIRAIGVANQRETTILWDKTSGEPVHRAIVWQSRQTADVCERLKRDGVEARDRQLTGLVIDPYFSASKISWLFDRYFRASPPRRCRRPAVRHRRQLVAVAPDRWRRSRHRLDQREPHAALQHPRSSVGFRAPRPPGHPGGDPADREAQQRSLW